MEKPCPGKGGKAIPRKRMKGKDGNHAQERAERPSPGKGGKAIPRKMMKGKDGKAMPRKGRPSPEPCPGKGGKAIPKAWKPRKLIDLTQKHDQNNL